MAVKVLYSEGHTQLASIDVKVASFKNCIDEIELVLAVNVKVRRYSDYSMIRQLSAYSKNYDQRHKDKQLPKGSTKTS